MRVQLVVSDARVEPQYLVLVFEEVPEGETLRSVQSALIRALEDAPV